MVILSGAGFSLRRGTGFASVEQVPDLLAEGGVLEIRHWNPSRSETCSTFLQRRKLLKMFWFRLSK
ncbi:MAG: hypothetical protein ACR2NN_22720 [Bryobacteraceae bacterium]